MTSNMGADEKHDLHGDIRIYDCFLYQYFLLLVNFALELKTAFSDETDFHLSKILLITGSVFSPYVAKADAKYYACWGLGCA